ncbi:uncharacterized protein LOC118741610 [Rhagoletis pomonella]|uniref:uncharacterized protein LOC118741610 n=1 Tax=Rhagoletis pomonella TaxID=28610 RepID=UPI00178020F7|nr:uncharacterized protein LOC118741610 [Rhagoletis pomonella]
MSSIENIFKSNECLYNQSSEGYRHTQAKQRLWNEIGDALQKTGLVCSKRWTYVHDYYIRRRGKPGTVHRVKQLKDVLSVKLETRVPIGVWWNTCVKESLVQLICNLKTTIPMSVQKMRIEIERSPFPKSKSQSVRSKNSEERLKLLREIAKKKQ